MMLHAPHWGAGTSPCDPVGAPSFAKLPTGYLHPRLQREAFCVRGPGAARCALHSRVSQAGPSALSTETNSNAMLMLNLKFKMGISSGGVPMPTLAPGLSVAD